jgi:hypothetical protein
MKGLFKSCPKNMFILRITGVVFLKQENIIQLFISYPKSREITFFHSTFVPVLTITNMKRTITTVFLFMSGVIAIYIGACLLFNPIAFEASANIPIANDVNLLSEIRSSGGTILATGICIVLGGFLTQLRKLSLTLSALFYLAYGVSRSIAMLIDGLPGSSLVTVTIAEWVIGILSVILLLTYLKQEKKEFVR